MDGYKVNYRVASAREAAVVDAAIRERRRQDAKWGPIEDFDARTPEQWLVILMEEVGELAKGVLKRDPDNVQVEATQVAAVALAIKESLMRRSMQERDDATD